MRPVASVRRPIPTIEKKSRARIIGFVKRKVLPHMALEE
jgi:hypothetical protein